jgi:hypothetical protein
MRADDSESPNLSNVKAKNLILTGTRHIFQGKSEVLKNC